MTLPARDRSGRLRNLTIAFRVSPEENREINSLVALSGLTKQDYILHKLTNREVTVYPSSRLQRGMADEAMRMYAELRRIERAGDMPLELKEVMETFARTFEALGRKEAASDVDKETRALRGMSRMG